MDRFLISVLFIWALVTFAFFLCNFSDIFLLLYGGILNSKINLNFHLHLHCYVLTLSLHLRLSVYSHYAPPGTNN